MAITRLEAQEILDLVADQWDELIGGTELRGRGGAWINEVDFPRLKAKFAGNLKKYFNSRGLSILG